MSCKRSKYPLRNPTQILTSKWHDAIASKRSIFALIPILAQKSKVHDDNCLEFISLLGFSYHADKWIFWPFNGRGKTIRIQIADSAFWGGGPGSRIMHWERDFSKCEITNRVGLNCEVGVCKIRSSAAWVFAWLRVSMRDDKRKMGPSFTGHQCAWLEGLWGQAVQQLKHHQGSCTHTQVRVSALDLSARLLLYPVWVGALEPLVVYR